MQIRKMLAIILIIILVMNLILFSFGMITMTQFWVTIIVIAVLAFQLIPRLKK